MDDVIDQILSDPMVTTIGGAVGVAFVALWLAGAWWAYSDATHRTGSVPAALLAAAWIIASTPLLLPLSLPVYALVRPPDPASVRRTRRLAAELAAVLEEAAPSCRACGRNIDPAWQRCPSCTTWLAQPCADCGEWSDGALAICPFCGGDDRSEPVIDEEAAAVGGRVRRARRPAEPVGSGRSHVPDTAERPPVPDARPLTPARVG